MDIKEKVKNLPQLPGVYLFKDSKGGILYIGKAANLKKRVQSYFTRMLCAKTQSMVSQIKDIEYIVTATEAQAQIKEAALIKERLPKYNVALRDDKSFPFICISDEEFPLVYVCRKKKQGSCDKALYFGPYADAKLLRRAVKIIRSVFGFRSCRKMPRDPCLYYRLKLCPAPCIGKISPEGYKEIIENIKLFLKGQQDTLLKNLAQKMHGLSRHRRYEDAALVRNQISALSLLYEGRRPDIDYAEEAEGLRKILGLEKPPSRIEAFDISNILGRESCGSLVSFLKGQPDKNNYRRFKIKQVEGIDDYAMLREVIRRRYSRLKEQKLPMPDLILIDGGKAHLSVARNEILKLGLEIPIISIAKEKENIYTLRQAMPLNLPQDSPVLHLLKRIRDEAHRFALSYHRILRKKKILEDR